MPPANPALTALLDSLPTNSTPFALVDMPLPPGAAPPPQPGQPAVAPTQQIITCAAHKQVACEACGVNFGPLNYMHQFMRGAPPEAIPPPPNMQVPPQRAEMVKNAKEQGNVSARAE
jgi:translocation protein SEC72